MNPAIMARGILIEEANQAPSLTIFNDIPDERFGTRNIEMSTETHVQWNYYDQGTVDVVNEE